MSKEALGDLLCSPIPRHGTGIFLLVCFIAAPAVGLTVTPSTSIQAPPSSSVLRSTSIQSTSLTAAAPSTSKQAGHLSTSTSTSSTSSTAGAQGHSFFPSLPIHSPLPDSTCQTGPEFRDGVQVSSFLIETDHVFLDLSEPVNCSGIITRWYYCHIVIAFRNTPAGLWPCVWRKVNHTEGYEMIGCNKFTIVPGNGDSVRCRMYVPPSPSELLRVREGDYIGFYVPDSGIIVALALAENDAGHYQLRSNETGFTSYLSDSDLILVDSISGRALLSAEIGKTTAILTCFCYKKRSEKL